MQQEDVNSLRIYYLGGDALFFYCKEERTLFTFFSWLNTIICWEVWLGRRIFFWSVWWHLPTFFFFLSNFRVNLNRSVEWRFQVFVYPDSPCPIADLGAQMGIYGRQRLQHLFFNCLALVWDSVAGFHLTGGHILPSQPASGLHLLRRCFSCTGELTDDLWRETADGRAGNFF